MKKVLTLMAVFAMFGFVSCGEKQPEAADATISAEDVTVEAGSTVQIGATTTSSAAITYSSDNTDIATVSSSGEVTGVKAGTANITLSVPAVEGKFKAAEKTIKATVTEPAPQPAATITIDGDFSDWSALEAGTFSKAVNDPDSPWEAVQEIRCFATPQTVYYYMRFEQEMLTELLENENEILPIRLNINTDGEFESGYTSYFLEGYDFIIEGALAEAKAWTTYDGEMHQRIDGKWNSLLTTGNGLVTGIGSGNQYEIALDRAKFNEAAASSSVPMPMGDEFQTGIRFYFINSNNKWDELSNMPNSSIDEEDGNGWGYLMRVKTQK